MKNLGTQFFLNKIIAFSDIKYFVNKFVLKFFVTILYLKLIKAQFYYEMSTISFNF